MSLRRTCRAGTFYPSSPDACRDLIRSCLSSAVAATAPGPVVGGIVPHAGWVYSGATAATTYRVVGEPAPARFVLFGAVHVPGVRRPSLSPATEWATPLGSVALDREAAAAIREAAGGRLDESEAAHAGEHSIEVQLPFLAELFPGARVVPVAVPPDPAAVEFGRIVGLALGTLSGRSVVIGSTDLTHYGPSFYGFAPAGVGPKALRWAKEENDRSFLDRLLAFDAEGALKDALEKRNACGAGAAAATVSAAAAMGATSAELLDHTTSHEAKPDASMPTDFVGYASVVFRAD